MGWNHVRTAARLSILGKVLEQWPVAAIQSEDYLIQLPEPANGAWRMGPVITVGRRGRCVREIRER